MRKPNTIGLGEYELEDLLAEIAERTDFNRLEIIDHTPCTACNGRGIIVAENYSISGHTCSTCSGMRSIGRQVVMWSDHKKVDISIQDDGRTLKAFISERLKSEREPSMFTGDVPEL